jgi:hypothetical protein
VSRNRALEEIERLDPVADHQRIVFLSSRFEFPFDTTRALEFALFRTFAVPGVSRLLDRTGEFRQRAQRRYDDTDILVSELMEHGYEGDRGRRALRRMNQLHGRFDIPNDEYQYVLSTFVFEPIRWNALYGWRPLTGNERLAYFHFWREVGRRMGIRDIPAEYEVFERFNRDFERDRFAFDEANQRVGTATRELFVGWFPSPLAPLVRSAIHAMMDDRLLTAFGFPPASPWVRALVAGALRLRSALSRLLPPRDGPLLRTEMRHRSHPDGYVIERLGPPSAPES